MTIAGAFAAWMLHRGKKLGETLFVSINTVKTPLKNIFLKLDVFRCYRQSKRNGIIIVLQISQK